MFYLLMNLLNLNNNANYEQSLIFYFNLKFKVFYEKILCIHYESNYFQFLIPFFSLIILFKLTHDILSKHN